MEADDFSSNIFYPANGVLYDGSDRWGIVTIKQVDGTDIYVSATNYSLSFAIYTNRQITANSYYNITVRKSPLS